MNYPIWELSWLGGGTLIAIISVLHVYISHLAVGGGLFIWLTDLKGYREKSPELHKYVKKHTWFFLLLTMVFGGMSGVGIWFVISLVNPAATSSLIHTFVFGWVIEWVFFLGEVVALLIYYYFFDDLDKKGRLALAFLYCLFAWLSLVVINAILSFMLTPGGWIESRSVWDGLLNPTYFSSTFFRTFASAMIAGLFGYVTAVFMKNSDFRIKMINYCSIWLLYSVAGLIVTGIWYYHSIPDATIETTFILNSDSGAFATLFIITSILIFVFGIIMMLRLNRTIQKVILFLLLIIGLGWMGGFEYMREIARKPYVIKDFMYSSSIFKADLPRLNTEGILPNAKWSEIKSVSDDNLIKAGKEIFKIECLACHTIGGVRNDIMPHVNPYPHNGILSLLEGLGKINNYMPPFIGKPKEKEALATYITVELNGGTVHEKTIATDDINKQTDLPPFDSETDEYLILAWSDLGINYISDCDDWFVLNAPGSRIDAQLIGRGDNLGTLTDDVELTYKIESSQDDNSISGTMPLDDDLMTFVAEDIPISPYTKDGGYDPFTILTIEAHAIETGDLIVSTKVVAPVSTELGCKNCHGGEWKINNRAGISDETATNILIAHDKKSGTNLYDEALAGNPQDCKSCHQELNANSVSTNQRLSLSASIHGWHANYMPFEGPQTCKLCHAATIDGVNSFYRDVHTIAGQTCVNCHGELTDHALSLLEAESGKRSAARMLANLKPVSVGSSEEINPRMPWVNEPECLTCHADFEQPEAGSSGFNVWTLEKAETFSRGTGEIGIRCAACHSSPHSIYPVLKPTNSNLQPLQYMGRPYAIGENGACFTCHMAEMDEPIHHENMNREARIKID